MLRFAVYEDPNPVVVRTQYKQEAHSEPLPLTVVLQDGFGNQCVKRLPMWIL